MYPVLAGLCTKRTASLGDGGCSSFLNLEFRRSVTSSRRAKPYHENHEVARRRVNAGVFSVRLFRQRRHWESAPKGLRRTSAFGPIFRCAGHVTSPVSCAMHDCACFYWRNHSHDSCSRSRYTWYGVRVSARLCLLPDNTDRESQLCRLRHTQVCCPGHMIVHTESRPGKLAVTSLRLGVCRPACTANPDLLDRTATMSSANGKRKLQIAVSGLSVHVINAARESGSNFR